MSSVLRARGLGRRVGSGAAARQLLQQVDLDVAAGSLVAIVGPSGAGKSSLLQILAALDPDYEGSLALFGQDLAGCSDAARANLRAQHGSFMFQAHNLLGHLSALDNVLLPAALGQGRADAPRALALLQELGLDPSQAARRPTALSGGEQQRVALARALYVRPRLLFCDEPTSSLDANTAQRLLACFASLRRGGTAILVATHDPAVVAAASSVLRLQGGVPQGEGAAGAPGPGMAAVQEAQAAPVAAAAAPTTASRGAPGRLQGALKLAWADLRAQPRRLLGQALALALGIFILGLVTSLGLGARTLVLEQLLQELPADTVEVVPRSVDLGLMQLSGGSLLGGRRLDASALAQLRGLPGAVGVYPRLEVPLPLGVQGGQRLFGHDLYADVFVTALPRALLEAELGAEAMQGSDLPVAFSSLLVETYNAAIAPVLHSPQLSDASLRGLGFDLVVGRSLLLGRRGARAEGRERAHLAGVSRYARRLSILIPLEMAEPLLARYGTVPTEPTVYDGALVRARDAAALPQLTRAIEGLGFALDHTAQRARRAMDLATALASSLGFLVLLLAASTIAQSTAAHLRQRRRELAVLRALGARRSQLLLMLLLQALASGLLGGGIGVLAAQLAVVGLDAALQAWLATMGLTPPHLHALPLGLTAGCVGAAALAALLGALRPAWHSARANVTQLLAE